MNIDTLKKVAAALDADTLKSFVHTARLTIDAIASEQRAAAAKAAPQPIDYAAADHDRSAPAGGWIDPQEVKALSAAMTEAIAAEKWADGFVTAIQLLAMVGAI